jgi:hypothetical protein
VTPGEDVGRQDIEAALETRRELGPTYEREVVDSFADRIENAIRTRVDAQLAHGTGQQLLGARHQTQQFALAIISLVAAIPISIVLGVKGEFLALLLSWGGIVAINVAWALSGRSAR